MPISMHFTVDASGANRKLQRVAGVFENLAPMYTAIGKALVVWVQENFARRGRLRVPGGWKRLSPNTVAAKGQSFPLYNTGSLARSFKYGASAHGVKLYSDHRLAEIHEYGTSPYTIRPKRGKFLAYMTAGGMRFSRVVRHPGVPARPMRPNIAQAAEIGRTAARAHLKEVLKDG